MLSRKTSLFLTAALFCLSLTGTAQASEAYTDTGTASWFGTVFHGRTTASGEPFDMYSMTAAHRTLDFGTIVKVVNTDNDREVLVKITDRGPFAKRRILDLSYGAALALDMTISGVATITLEVVSDTDGNPLQSGQTFFVRLDGDEQVTPQEQLSSLVRIGYHEATTQLQIMDGEETVLGPFDSFDDAQIALLRISTTNPQSTITLSDSSAVQPVVATQASLPH